MIFLSQELVIFVFQLFLAVFSDRFLHLLRLIHLLYLNHLLMIFCSSSQYFWSHFDKEALLQPLKIMDKTLYCSRQFLIARFVPSVFKLLTITFHDHLKVLHILLKTFNAFLKPLIYETPFLNAFHVNRSHVPSSIHLFLKSFYNFPLWVNESLYPFLCLQL